MVQSLQCPNCGAPQLYDGGDDPVISCPYCNTSVILPESLLNAGKSGPASEPAGTAGLSSLLNAGQLSRLRQMGALIRKGEKIEAIKLYREAFGVGLKEAKYAVDGLAAGKPVAIGSLSVQAAGSRPEIDQDILRLAREGQKIEAIKLYREKYGVGLKQAKDVLDFFETSGVLLAPQEGGGSLENLLSQTDKMIEVAQLLQEGDRQAAIQRYAELFNVSPEQADQALEGASQTVVITGPGISMQAEGEAAGQRQAAAAVVGAAGAAGGISCFALGMTALIFLSVIVPVFIALVSSGGPLEGLWARLNPLAFARLETFFGERGSGPGLLDDPRSLAVDSEGRVFVANYRDGRIQRFDSSGKYQMLWNIGPEQYADSLTVDRAGFVFAVYRGKIWKFDGDDGRALGEITHPQERWFEAAAATADGGLVAVVNTEDLLRYDAGGQLVFSLAEAGRLQSGSPDGVEAVAVDGVGNIYLLTDEDYVLVYSPGGQLLARFGSAGEGGANSERRRTWLWMGRAGFTSATSGASRSLVQTVATWIILTCQVWHLGWRSTTGATCGWSATSRAC